MDPLGNINSYARYARQELLPKNLQEMKRTIAEPFTSRNLITIILNIIGRMMLLVILFLNVVVNILSGYILPVVGFGCYLFAFLAIIFACISLIISFTHQH
jgi:hypothetical protein